LSSEWRGGASVRSPEAFALANEIAHCPVMVRSLKGDTHPCSKVVLEQWPDAIPFERRLYRWPFQHLLPEPWTGHIETAPLLFVASNPAGGAVADADPPYPPIANELSDAVPSRDDAAHPSLAHPHSGPKFWWEREAIHDYYDSLFDVWVDENDRVRPKPGGSSRPSPYWRGVHECAERLFGHAVTPGIHYALTEVVHCRSMKEKGVKEALKPCTELYLSRVLALSPARTIVVFGVQANAALRNRYPDSGRVTEPIEVEGLMRRLAYLDHPGYRGGARRFLNNTEIRLIQDWLGRNI
jgi:hypothetical protein